MVRPAVVATLALVLLAGCSGFPDVGRGPTPSTPVTDAAGAPPGVSDSLVVDPAALAGGHAAVIDNASYVVATNRTVRTTDGTLVAHLRVQVAVDRERRFLATAATAGPAAPVFLGNPPAQGTYWSNGATYLRRLHRDGRTTYVRIGRPSTWVGTWHYWAETVPFGGRANTPQGFFAAVFSEVPTAVTGRETVPNHTVYHLENQGKWPVRDRAFPGDVRSVEAVSLDARVDERGFVRRMDLSYGGRLDGRNVTVHRRIRYTALGDTTVDRPAWYDLAMARNGTVESGELQAVHPESLVDA